MNEYCIGCIGMKIFVVLVKILVTIIAVALKHIIKVMKNVFLPQIRFT